MPSVFVVGASRGIGREFVRQYSQSGWEVTPACRDPKAAGFGSEAVALDVVNAESVDAASKALSGRAFDVMIVNAGVFGPRNLGLGELDYDAWRDVLETNVLGAMRVAEAFTDHVARSDRKLIAFLSSVMGSVEETTAGNNYIYRSSKACLNMAVRCMTLEVQPRGVDTVLFHPGWVQTDMGGPQAAIDVQTSVGGMKAEIEKLKPGETGKFLAYDGREIPW